MIRLDLETCNNSCGIFDSVLMKLEAFGNFKVITGRLF